MAKERSYTGYHIEDNKQSEMLLHNYIDHMLDEKMTRNQSLKPLKEIGFCLSSTGNKYPVYPKSRIKGADILEDPKLAYLHDQIDNPDLYYTLTKEVWRKVNHKQRLQNLWKNRNKQDLKDYVTEVIAVYDDSVKGFDFSNELTDQYIKVEVLKSVAMMQIEAQQKKKDRKRKKGGKKRKRVLQ